MPPKDKMVQQAAAQKVADKTFGMKNKNKSKQVQQKIAQMQASAGGAASQREKETEKMKMDAARAAMDQVLFKEAKTKKEIEREKMAKAEAAIKKAEKVKEPDKRDVFTDSRDDKKDDDMAEWDDEKLKSVVDSKKTAGERIKTSIICKHFIDAVEKRTYGWFWVCPNDGDKCQYRHALPEGYVLKRDKDPNAEFVEAPRIEDEIEARRKALTTRTPVTFERLQAWLTAKQERLQKLRDAGGKEDKISALAREVAEAEEAVNLAKSEYEAVAARVDGEMQRFQTEKLADFKRYVVGFLKLQLEYSERVQQTWRELLPRLEEIDSSKAQPADVQ